MKSHYRGVEFEIACTNHSIGDQAEWTWQVFSRNKPGNVSLQGAVRGDMSHAMKACFATIDSAYADLAT
jgi:hypothetical protein